MEPTTESTSTSLIKKIKIPFLLAIFVIAAVVMIYAVTTVKHKTPTSTTQQENSKAEAPDVKDLQIQSLTKKIETAETNIKKLYDNEIKLNKLIEKHSQELEEDEKTIRENRSYIAMIYKKLLDDELQIQSIGGGYNTGTKKQQEEVINPLIGTDSLPSKN